MEGKRRRKEKKSFVGQHLYTWVMVGICIFGCYFVYERAKELWMLRVDMEQTIEQENNLMAEQDMLKQRKERLQDPKEIETQARSQFGLVKPGEIPYKR